MVNPPETTVSTEPGMCLPAGSLSLKDASDQETSASIVSHGFGV